MTKSLDDLRKCKTLDDAALNPDGTYNGANALSWLSDILTGGNGITAKEIKTIFEDEKAKRIAHKANKLRNLNSGGK